jgi:hypothetical protein
MRGLDARTGELFSYVDLEDRVPAQHRSRRIIKPTAFFPCRAAWEAHSPSIPSVLPPPRAPPKKTSNTGHASRAVCAAAIRSCTQWRLSRHPPSVLLVCIRHVFRLPFGGGGRNSGSANDGRARDLTRMLNRRKARMAEGSGGLGHLVTPADRLARIAHDPQHVGERQLAGCGCFLPHLLVCTAGRSRGAPSARPFSAVCVHRYHADRNRGPYVRHPVHMYHNMVQYATASAARYRFR